MTKRFYTSRSDNYAFPRRRKKRFDAVRFFSFSFLGALCVLAGIAYFILFGGFWNVTSVRVTGSRLVEDSSFISALVSEMHSSNFFSGILGHDNILFWMFRGEPAPIQWMPEVKNIEIIPDFWLRTVHVSITERSVKAVVCKEDAVECYAIDNEGVVFSQVPWVEGALIPRFEEDGARIVFGKKYFKKTEWFENVFLTLSTLERNGLTPAHLKIRSDNSEEWEVTIPSKTLFYFSLNFIPENFEEVLRDVILRGELDAISYFDFRIQNRVYYK